MTFSATDAAFEGFRIMRRDPVAVGLWALAYLIFFGLVFAVFGGSIAKIAAVSADMQTGGEPTMQDFEALGLGYAVMASVVGPLSLVLSAVLSAAVVRAVLTPDQKGFGYMGLGGDELRVLLVSVVVVILISLAAIVAFGAVGLLAGFTAASGLNILWLLVTLLGLAAVAFVVWLSLRLSLAVPITVDERRVAIFDSFAMTKGRSLPLLGMMIIACIMAMLLSAVSSILARPLTFAAGGLDSLVALEGEPTLTVLRAAGPAIAVWVVLNAVFSALQMVVLSAPFAAAYRDLKRASVHG